VEVTLTKVTPIFPHDNFVQWTVTDATGVLSYFELERSGSPEGPWENISGKIDKTNYYFVDKPSHLMGLTTIHWYRIKAVPTTGEMNSDYSTATTVQYYDQPLRGRIARKARYDLGIVLKRLTGVKFLLLKKKRFGGRCTTCYNEITKDAMLSSCGDCYGTTYEGGFHNPIAALGKFDPKVIQQSMNLGGKSEVNVLGITMLDYPLAEPEDLLVEVHTNRRFKITKKIQTEGSRVLVHQDLQVSELSHSASEYGIPLTLV
jgi:hypothetical protein